MFVIVALTARAGQYIFCEQVVRVNQEQFHFGYNKLDTLVKCRCFHHLSCVDATYAALSLVVP